MSSVNKVILVGRLTRDPEMRYTPSGKAVTSFSIATNHYSKGSDGERRESADFHNCVAWAIGNRDLPANIAEYCRKGSLAYVEGRLQTRSWEDQEGNKRRTTEIVVHDIQFLSTKTESGGQRQQSSSSGYGGPDVDPDDIPF